MKAIRTPDCNTTLTLPGGTDENDLPAQRALLYDESRGETTKDARAGFVTWWMPTEAEARRLDAGAAVELTVHGAGHPPVSVGVTQGIVPERELIERGHVDRALGWLYAQLKDNLGEAAGVLPPPTEFADLWSHAVDATKPRPPGEGEPEHNGTHPSE